MEKQLSKKYTEISQDYNKYISRINSTFASFYIKNIPESATNILDLGCGPGGILNEISKNKQNLNLYGLDPVLDFVEISKHKLPNAKIVLGNAENLPFEDAFFDYVICHAVFQHVNREESLTEIKRVLKNSGRVIITEVLSKKEPTSFYGKILEKYMKMRRNIFYIFNYGPISYFYSEKYSKSSDWRELTEIHRDNRFSYDQIIDFYSQNLPGNTHEKISPKLISIIWDKS